MARAKRTDRAEARRKYRAYLQAQEEAEAGASQTAGVSGARASSRDQGTQPNLQPGVRMGIFAAARAAARQPHYIDDIRNIRSLVFGSNAVWPILAMCVVAGAYTAIRIDNNGQTNDPIVPYLAQFVFYPVPLLPPMIAGFLAPRSTWLAGLIAGFIASMTLVVVIGLTALRFTSGGGIPTASDTPQTTSSPVATTSAGPSQIALATASATAGAASVAGASPSASPNTGSGSGSTSSTSGPDLFSIAFQLLSTSLAFGALMGALSGWYKRFLALTSGSRKPPSRGNQRPAQRHRPAATR